MTFRMKEKINFYFLLIIILSTTILISCSKSSFPPAGTTIECNGKLLQPILNPTQRPVFPGGSQAMFKFLKSNFKLPHDFVEKVHGKVRIAFIITKEGDICDVRTTSKPKEYIDDEFIRIFRIMPKWIPATNEGKIVDSYYLLDIRL